MIRHTGGLAIGATSTRSRSRLLASLSASGTGLMPSWSPSGPMRRTSRARMRSLMRCCSRCSRCGAAMAAHSCAMGGVSLFVLVGSVARREARGAHRPPPPRRRDRHHRSRWTRTHVRWPGGGRPHFASNCPGRVAHVDGQPGENVPDDQAASGDDAARTRGRPAGRRPSGDRRGPPPRRRGAGRGRRHQPRDGPVRAGGDPPRRPSSPTCASAALAIDAVACLVDGLGDRLGPEAATMRDALGNIRLAFVEIKSRVAAPQP